MTYTPLKFLFNAELVIALNNKIRKAFPDFDSNGMIHEFEQSATNLELKDRIELIADLWEEHLAVPYEKKVKGLMTILGPENEKETGMFKEYYWIMPIAKLVEKYGLEHYKISMDAIKEITKRSTGEYAIRPYLRHYKSQTLTVMNQWAKDENFHVRRLASEGLRIRLPWATKMEIFADDPQPILDIIEQLKDDEVRYIQKSVANNMNDLLKENYTFSIEVLERWAIDAPSNRNWVIRHALRNYLKAGDSRAKSIIDY